MGCVHSGAMRGEFQMNRSSIGILLLSVCAMGCFGAENESVSLMNLDQHKPRMSPDTVFEITDQHALVGKSYKIVSSKTEYGYFDCEKPSLSDWTSYEYLAMDVYSPSETTVKLAVTIRDGVGTGKYDDRYNGTFQLGHGMNRIKIALATIGTLTGSRLLDLRQVKTWAIIVPKDTCLFVSNVRLSEKAIPGLSILPLFECDDGRTPNDGNVKTVLSDEHLHPAAALGLKCKITQPQQWVGGYGKGGVPTRRWGKYQFFRFRAYQPGPEPMTMTLEIRDTNKTRSMRTVTIEPGKDHDFDLKLADFKELKDIDSIHQWLFRFDKAYAQPLYLSHLRLVSGDESLKPLSVTPRSREDIELGRLRTEATMKWNELVQVIESARAQAIDVSYFEMYPIIAELVFDYRWFVPMNAPHRAASARYVLDSCSRATADLQAIMAGKKEMLKVPASPKMESLRADGRHFRDATGRRLVVASQDGMPGGISTFTGPRHYVSSASASGGTRYDVRDCPIWEVYNKHPETRRVGWDHFCGHFISDAASIGGQGEAVSICIESPLTQKAISDYIKVKSFPALQKNVAVPVHTYQNWESTYCCYCDRTRDMFRKFVTQRHKDIAALNKIWGTAYGSFDDVVLPHHSAVKIRAAWYDFSDFNCNRFADHFEWVRKELEKIDPKADRLFGGIAPAHSFYGSIGPYGHDVELMHAKADKGIMLNECGGRFYVTDLLKSIAGPNEIVADVEFHGVRPPLIMGHLLHGLAAIDWCEWLTSSSEYAGFNSIVYNPNFAPEEMELFLRQLLDSRRLEPEVIAFDQLPKEVALLYSRTSLLQTPPEFIFAERSPYTNELINAYSGAQAAGAAVRFLTEKQLMEGRVGESKILIVPGVCYENRETFEAALKFADNGGTVLVTPNSWLRDEYDRPADYLAQLGISVTRMRLPSFNKTETSDVSREGGFLQGITEEVRFSNIPRSDIQVPAGTIGVGALNLKAAGILQDIKLSAPARVLGTFADGNPALVQIKRGKGHIFYLASPLEPASMTALLDRLYASCGVARPVTARLSDGRLPSEFECRAVKHEGRTLVYLMNLGTEAREVKLTSGSKISSVQNLTFNTIIGTTLTVPPKEVFILQVDSAQ
jgi:hypothetical protein